MNRSVMTRRRFVQAVGTVTSCGVAFRTTTSNRGLAAQHELKQSEDCVRYHRDMHGSDIMVGSPPPKDKRVTRDNYLSSRDRFRWSMLNADTVFHTREIEMGDTPVRPLPRCTVDPERVDRAKVEWGKAGLVTVAEWLRGSNTYAFLALHDGHIVTEQYFGAMTPRTRHRAFSIAKSFTATAGATLLSDGTVDVCAPATQYIPELANTTYDGATVRQLLDMQVSVRYRYFCPADEVAKGNEKAWEFGTAEYRHAQHEQARLQRVAGMVRKLESDGDAGVYDVVFDLKDRELPHGAAINYVCPSALALQLVLERATGISMIELLSAKLWRRLGTEQRATMQIDDLGTALAHGGLAVTARDLGRWGQMLLEDGRVGSEQVVPKEFVEDIQQNTNQNKFNESSNLWGNYLVPGCGYRSYFFIAPKESSPKTRFWSGGGWGQWCFIDPERRNVIVKFSTETDYEVANPRDFAAVCSFSRALPELAG